MPPSGVYAPLEEALNFFKHYFLGRVSREQRMKWNARCIW